MPRKLASIQVINAVEPIDGADKIELVRVLGWQCVTQKSNNFKVGDKVCYFEIDSMIPTPAGSPFEFLKKKPEDTQARLRTIRLKKKLSQGLVLPLETLGLSDVAEGDDVSERLGITLYEPEVPAHLRGVVKGQFPHFLVKTDETRIQTCPGVLERNMGKLIYITEKLDGSSLTAYYYNLSMDGKLPFTDEQRARGYAFGVASRNLELEFSEDNAYWKAIIKYDLESKLHNLNRNIAIQGELYGAGLNANRLQQTTANLALFNVYNLEDKKYFGYQEFNDIIDVLGVPKVPVIASNIPLSYTVDQLVTYSMGQSVINSACKREGIVIRTMVDDYDKDLGRFSFKVINPDYLIHHGE